MSDPALKPGERIDHLLRQDLRIIQNPADFCFSMDAVLLAHFTALKPNERIVDLGTGSGVIPLLLASRRKDLTVTGLEIQPQVAERAERSVRLNGLQDRISIVCGDLKEAEALLPTGKFTVVTSNPPYMGPSGGLRNETEAFSLARHEIACTLEDVIAAAARLLTFKGRLAMVHRPQRLVDLFWCMRSYNLEPKRLRLVHPRLGRKPNMVLVEAVLGAGVELEVAEPLYIYGQDGEYTPELIEMYYPEAGR